MPRSDLRRRRWLVLATLAAIASTAAIALSQSLDASIDHLPPAQRMQWQQRQARWQALTPVEQAVYGQRQLRWQALPEAARREQREQWQAWQELPEHERAQLRRVAADVAALPAPERQRLRATFDALDGRIRRGWLLGPVLGAEYERLQPLFAFVAADERRRLLDVVRAMTPVERAQLARLAQGTPPQSRAALRGELLSTATDKRGAWLQQRLER
ncbi:uncharacterized protein DUF3106 [Luteimonas cucumeris]|uniref:Uncharacterized protein DUF3106 n=1 Tax=Luteimonas cucumeris TaxID=985012 RepID=A0A562L1U5_9GAMM|nr:DUF3106 domain-containing protein [Luteimonas cucumeris]TWI01649.1 uncharacterized protein DUF3106 [Luteimonas cucumeris]